MNRYSTFSFDKETFSKIEKIYLSNLTLAEALKFVQENKGTSYISEDNLTENGDFKINCYGFNKDFRSI